MSSIENNKGELPFPKKFLSSVEGVRKGLIDAVSSLSKDQLINAINNWVELNHTIPGISCFTENTTEQTFYNTLNIILKHSMSMQLTHGNRNIIDLIAVHSIQNGFKDGIDLEKCNFLEHSIENVNYYSFNLSISLGLNIFRFPAIPSLIKAYFLIYNVIDNRQITELSQNFNSILNKLVNLNFNMNEVERIYIFPDILKNYDEMMQSSLLDNSLRILFKDWLLGIINEIGVYMSPSDSLESQNIQRLVNSFKVKPEYIIQNGGPVIFTNKVLRFYYRLCNNQ